MDEIILRDADAFVDGYVAGHAAATREHLDTIAALRSQLDSALMASYALEACLDHHTGSAAERGFAFSLVEE